MKELKNIEKIKDDKYRAFEEKFKHKVTTDDCYTPEPVYEVIKNYVIDYYKLENVKIERPFYPGGDYKNYEYSENSVVIHNPPFSILAEIKRFYIKHNIKFFLFAPSLTVFSSTHLDLSYVIVDASIEYENKAKVNTSFVTNMDDYMVRTEPELHRMIKQVQEDNKVNLPKYIYPYNIITASHLGKYVKAGEEIKFKKEELHFVRQLDAQKPHKKTIYGSGFFINDERAKEMEIRAKEIELAKTTKWELSDKEKSIIESLS